MAIRIISEPDVYLTEAELSRLRFEYQKSYQYYAGPVPTFEQFVREQQSQKKLLLDSLRHPE